MFRIYHSTFLFLFIKDSGYLPSQHGCQFCIIFCFRNVYLESDFLGDLLNNLDFLLKIIFIPILYTYAITWFPHVSVVTLTKRDKRKVTFYFSSYFRIRVCIFNCSTIFVLRLGRENIYINKNPHGHKHKMSVSVFRRIKLR